MSARKTVFGVALLMAIGAMLVLVFSGGGASGQRTKPAPSIGPNVAVRVAGDPAEAGARGLLRRFVAAAVSAAPATTLAHVERGLRPAQLAFARTLLAHADWLTFTLERSCPPPAMLGCHAELRVCARLGTVPANPFASQLRATVMAALRAGGLRRLAFRGDSIHSAEETLARWRIDGDVLELTTGWLQLGHCQMPPPGSSPPASVEANPRELAQLFGT